MTALVEKADEKNMHLEEAGTMTVDQTTSKITVTTKEEKAIRRAVSPLSSVDHLALKCINESQFDRRLVPIVCILYVLSYLDRGNIGNAKTAGAQEDLNLSSSQWTWVLNAFYIAYVLFEWVSTIFEA